MCDRWSTLSSEIKTAMAASRLAFHFSIAQSCASTKTTPTPITLPIVYFFLLLQERPLSCHTYLSCFSTFNAFFPSWFSLLRLMNEIIGGTMMGTFYGTITTSSSSLTRIIGTMMETMYQTIITSTWLRIVLMMETMYQTMTVSSCSLIAFAYWSMAFALFLWSTPLYPLLRPAMILSSGFYMVTTWRSTYKALGNSLLIWCVVILWAMPQNKGIYDYATSASGQKDGSILIRLQDWMQQFLISLSSSQNVDRNAQSVAAATTRIIRHWLDLLTRSLMVFSRDVALFLCWYPITLSFGTILRVTSVVTVVSILHAYHILSTVQTPPSGTRRHRDVVSLWVDLRQRFEERNFAVSSLLLLLGYTFCVLPLWILMPVLALASLGLVSAVLSNPTLQGSIENSLVSIRRLLPQGAYLEYYIQSRMLLYLEKFLGPFTDFAKQWGLIHNVKEQFFVPAFRGAVVGLMLALLSSFSDLSGVAFVYTLAGVLPVFVLLSSPTNTTALGTGTAFSLGTLGFVSLEGFLTGFVLSYRIASPLRLMAVIAYLPFWFVWFWFCLALAVLQILPYTTGSGNWTFRKLLFELWVLTGESVVDGVQII